MLGEREARVVSATPFDLHGVTYYDVTLRYEDGTQETARLGAEAVPDSLEVGEVVLAMRAANMVLSVRRP